MKLIILAIYAISITACAYTPSTNELKNASYGNPPTNVKESIRNELFTILKDPDSAKVRNITKPKKDFFINPKGFNTKFEYGWHVCASINSKNGHGAYLGYEIYHFFFINNKLVFTPKYKMNSGRTLTCN